MQNLKFTTKEGVIMFITKTNIAIVAKFARKAYAIGMMLLLILMLALPLKADNGMIVVYEGNYTETQSCLPLVELECPQIESFLREFIFPIYRNNHGNKDFDKIYLKIVEEENKKTAFSVLLYLNDKSELKLKEDYILKGGYEYSVAIIDDIRVIIISKKSCSFVKKKFGKICFKGITMVYINDACAEWNFQLKNGDLVLVDFRDWGISWLKNLKREKYIPNFKPIKRIYNHKRKFSLFREAGLSTPPWLPDSMKINEPYSGF